MTRADHVKASRLQREEPAAQRRRFHLGPRAGRAVVATRIRLADSQKVVGHRADERRSFWSASADVIVTLAACIEGELMARALSMCREGETRRDHRDQGAHRASDGDRLPAGPDGALIPRNIIQQVRLYL